MTTPAALPEGSVLLHIGPQKTGSTAIQMAMHESRQKLAEHGVLYPGTGMRPREAGWAVLGIGSAVGRRPPRIAAWDRLVAEVDANVLPRVCVSNEDFARADDQAVERIVSALGADRIQLVYVARRLDKLLPSHWQERIKARLTLSYVDFLQQVLEDPTGPWESRMMWEPHDVATVLERWARHVDRDRITVVVADEDDRDWLPRTFESLLALPTGLLVPPSTKSNTSLSYPATEALRRVNQLAYDEGWTATEYWRIVQAGIAVKLKQRSDGSPRLKGVPARFLDLVADRSDRQVDALLAAGVRVLGDPERLRVRGRVEPVEPPPVVEAVSLDLLADVVSGTRTGAEKLRAARERAAARQAQAATRTEPSGRELLALLARRGLHRAGLGRPRSR